MSEATSDVPVTPAAAIPALPATETSQVAPGMGSLQGTSVANGGSGLSDGGMMRSDGDAHLRFATEAGRIGIWELDLGTGELTVSPLFKENLGIEPGITPSWADLERMIHPEDRDRRSAAVARALASGTEYDVEYRIIRHDGAIRWLHARAQMVCGQDGTPLRLVGISFDVTERRSAELRVELSEESLRLAADAAEVGTWDLDLTTNELTWSDRTKAMFGISPHRPCTMDDFYAGLHPDDFAATTAAFASALDPAVRATYDVEYRTIGKEDGVTRWVAAKGKGLFEGGLCRRAIGTAIDITARKRAAMRQTFLLELLDRLRHLTDPNQIMEGAVQALGKFLNADRVGYGQIEPDQNLIVLETCYANGVAPLGGTFALNTFGAHHVALQRRGLTVAIDDVESDPRNDSAMWAAIETRAFVSVPLIRGGQFRATLFVNRRAPHVWSAEDVGLIEDVAARIWDALERARAEEAIRRLNASLGDEVEKRTRELDRTWRLAPVVMVVGGPDGTLLEANPAWTRLLGWTAEETIGHDVMEFVAPEDRESGAAGMARLFEGLPVIEYDLSFLAKSGERRRISWTTVPEGGRLYGYGRDITDQLVAEDRLRQAQKMEAVGQLTGGLAHDFNNLLTGIAGGLELMEKRVAQSRLEDLPRYIEAAKGAARRAAALTQRLLAFSRRQTLDPKPTDVNALVAGMAELIRRTVGPELEFSVDAAPDLWNTLVDPHQLESALLNLCINSRDAMPHGGRVTVETANHDLDAIAAQERDLPPGQYVSLAVIDTGIGMTAETIRRAFDPFFTTKPLGAGTGLGLSMVYGFARQSGGQVRISSEVGRGARVCIYLPRYSGRADSADPAIAPGTLTRAQQGEAVLVVDDETTIRMLVAEVLGELGYTAIEAVDGASGLKVLQSGRRIDLLVTDVGLPGGINGRQLADAARSIHRGLPVLFITGYAESAILDTGDLAPGMQILTKPFAIEAVAERIRSLIAESGSTCR